MRLWEKDYYFAYIWYYVYTDWFIVLIISIKGADSLKIFFLFKDGMTWNFFIVCKIKL